MVPLKAGQQHRIGGCRMYTVQQDRIGLRAVAGGHNETEGVKIAGGGRLERCDASHAVGGDRHKERLLSKDRMEATVLCHMGQQIRVCHSDGNTIQLQIRKFIAFICIKMEEKCILIIDLQTIHADSHSALYGKTAV